MPAISAYAGLGAQESDIHGAPSFASFKRYAAFNTDLADFSIDFRQLQRLLAESGYGAVGPGMGLGLGDLHILFNSVAKRGALSYDGMLQLCRLLIPRLAKVEAMMASSQADDRSDPLTYRPGTTTTTATTATATTITTATATTGTAWAAARSGRAADLRALRAAAAAEADAAAAAAAAAADGGGEGPAGLAAEPSGWTSVGAATPGLGRGASLRRQESDAAPPGMLAPRPRPASASRLTAASTAATAAGYGPSTSGRDGYGNGLPPTGAAAAAASSGPGSLGVLAAMRDPPVVLRERVPPPPCIFPGIAARIAGVQALYRDGEMPRVARSLWELQRDWESTASASALSAALRRHHTAAAAPPDDAAATKGEIPLEGRIWLLLLGGCCAMLEGKHRAARRSLQAAESLFNPNELGMEHPYHYCIHLCMGLAAYYEQQHEEAVEKFEAARELAELLSHGSFDVTARRNAAACLNNKGVCLSLLGRRSDAVVAFRAAHALVRAAAGLPESPEALVALRNLTKALKQSFALSTSRLRPSTAPPTSATFARGGGGGGGGGGFVGSAIVGATSVPRDQKLQTFLQSAITLRAPPPTTAPPAWCTKVTPEEVMAKRKAKEAAAKKKAQAAADKGKSASSGKDGKDGKPKKKAPKKPGFEAMAQFPFAAYSVANVKLEVKKKKKGAGAKKAGDAAK